MNNYNAKPVRLSKSDTLIKYYDWLCSLIIDNNNYSKLINLLYRKEFIYFIPNDDNRAYEGRELTAKFAEINDIEYVYDDYENNCSMLEMLIALSFRCEEVMTNRQDFISYKEFFWTMLHNVNLTKYADENWSVESEFEVEFILTRINTREYDANGKGGFFPLKYYKKDQRRVELWYQMNGYLVENYYKDDLKFI
jgi:hypothetical protein